MNKEWTIDELIKVLQRLQEKVENGAGAQVVIDDGQRFRREFEVETHEGWVTLTP